MIQNNYFTENKDILLQFNEIIDWKEAVDAYEDGFTDARKYQETGDEKLAYAPSSLEEATEFYRSTMESLGEVAGKTIAARAKRMDEEGLKFKDGKVTFPDAMIECFQKMKEAGLSPFCISRKHGGLGMPLVAQAIAMELVARADASFYITMSCINLAETIERYGTPEMVDQWVPKIASGDAMAAMALTEPNYGSDLPNVQTRATKNPDGKWIINGTKRFITHACGFSNTPSVILTLARTGSPTSGARGLSFFLVEGKDVQIASIEKKMGLHTSPTCEVVYENSPALLIGEEGNGLVKYAMGMMNTARLSIAGQSMGIANAAFAEAKKYASERLQFGKAIEQIPAVKKMLLRMEREVIGMRCLLIEASRTIDKYIWKTERMEEAGVPDKEIRKDEEIKKWEKLANFFTPLAKYYISEMCNTIAYDALQIHGGAGYTEDYDVARIYKDARITNIYEGTTQLQVVAAIGGVVSGMSSAGILRAYIDDEMKHFEATSELLKVREIFEEIVSLFRNIKDSDAKDSVAFETVETSARFLIGMLLERSLSKLNPNERTERAFLIRSFNMESEAICSAHMIRVKNASIPELVPA